MGVLRNYGPLIQKIRLAKGMTQARLAELAGTSQVHISKIESGQTDPRIGTVRTIFNALDEDMMLKTETFEIFERIEMIDDATSKTLGRIENKIHEYGERILTKLNNSKPKKNK